MAPQQQQFEEGVTEGDLRMVCVWQTFLRVEEQTQGAYKYQGLFIDRHLQIRVRKQYRLTSFFLGP